ncbi:formate/nitrite transporter family protein [Rhizobium laguerreae]|uniref:formate/nitrite transporter family protein n=1 Tax=Rhizobium laguerreae TaxID=1076926 RepID=UPI001FE843E8|nr:formate/nitrite transporter family protein [Rhizobium laguerreae]
MYQETIATLVEAGEHKVTGIRENMLGFFIGAVMAGAYIGFGNIIMYSATAHVDAAWVRLVSGAVFSAALTIVIFAGSELFTGTAMYMPLAVLSRRATFSQLLGVWATTWLGNLVGAVTLAALSKPLAAASYSVTVASTSWQPLARKSRHRGANCFSKASSAIGWSVSPSGCAIERVTRAQKSFSYSGR